MTTDNQSITVDVRPVLEILNRFAQVPAVQAVVREAQALALARLNDDANLRVAFVPINLASLKVALPEQARSLRVVATRGAGGDTVERHANCAQYLFVLDALLETHVETSSGWRIDRYGQGDEHTLENRWHYLPQGVWHKSLAPGASSWSVLAIHSAAEVTDEFR